MADQRDPAETSSAPPEVRPDTDAIPEAELVPEAEVRRDPPPRPPEPPLPPPAPAPRRSGAFLGFVLGGVLAAAAGFVLAQFVKLGESPDAVGELAAKVQQQEAILADLRKQIENQPAPPAPDVSAELADFRAQLEARIAELPPAPDMSAVMDNARTAATDAVADLKSRIDALELRPAAAADGIAGGSSDQAVAALQAELQAMRAQIATESKAAAAGVGDQVKAMVAEAQAQIAAAKDEAARLKAEAATAGATAMAQAALARIRAAIDGGGPFTSAVDDLGATGHEVPQPLADAATAGVPTMAELQQSYPAAARAALDASLRADMGDSWTTRAANFLRTQTGARSLTPLEGDGPDAILSRAEAALNQGDLAGTLTELATLPEAAKPAMAGWIAQAEARQAAIEAATTLSTALDAE